MSGTRDYSYAGATLTSSQIPPDGLMNTPETGSSLRLLLGVATEPHSKGPLAGASGIFWSSSTPTCANELVSYFSVQLGVRVIGKSVEIFAAPAASAYLGKYCVSFGR